MSRHNGLYGAATGQVEELLRFIDQKWSFMASDNCIPIKVTLQLMDPSSLGLADQYEQFLEVHKQLKNALKVIVNQHHQGFNSSIGNFHKIQGAIHAAQHRVRTLRNELVQAKSNLTVTKPELRSLAQSSQSYDQMLQVLGTIEQLQQVPEILEAQISEKRFLGAVDTLLEALKLIRKPEMEEIGALSDLHVYLGNKEYLLADILVEELHNHLYLKSPYCEERWKALVNPDPSNPTFDDGDRAMLDFLSDFNGARPMLEDPTRNPEADTFYYIQLLLESLNKMSRLEFAVDAIENRLPVELYHVLERTHAEVLQRHPSVIPAIVSSQQKVPTLGEGTDTEQTAKLEDMLATLFAKYEAIAEGHRVLHDVTAAIIRREGYDDASNLNRSFGELWKLLQSEIRSFLHDHLATKGDISHRSRHDDGFSTNIFQAKPRDRTRKIFKLSDTDGDSTELMSWRDDLESILKASVPGLVINNQLQIKDEHSPMATISAVGHKPLVEPSVFNMAVLLKPCLYFLERLRGVVPMDSGVVSSTLTAFLDDFLVDVFYPQLDETLLELCGRCMTEIDAFQPHPQWQLYANRPIFSGTARFYELIEAFCVMLDSLPHEQSFSQLLITQMRAYYDKCHQWSKNLLQRVQLAQDGTPKLRLAAEIAASPENNINVVVGDLIRAATPDYKNVLVEREAGLMLQLVKTRRLEEADLINDRKTLTALCTLQVSLKWLATRCQKLRFISPRAVDSSDGQTHQARRWNQNPKTGSTPTGPYLPLDSEKAKLFDGAVSSFNELSLSTLRTLHIDLRLHVLRGIYTAMDTTYALGQPYNDPDPAIIDLCSFLGTTYDAVISAGLLTPQYGFLTALLHVLANTALTSLVGCIAAMDPHGCRRMQLNAFVLQQNFRKSMQKDADLEFARKFYALAEEGPQAISRDGPRGGYAREDLKALVRLNWDPKRDDKLGSVDDFVKRLGA